MREVDARDLVKEDSWGRKTRVGHFCRPRVDLRNGIGSCLTLQHDVLTFIIRVIRTQIQLTEQQARQLRSIAHEKGLSLAEVIRQCIDEALVARHTSDRAERYSRAWRVIGRFEDACGATDVAAEHDQYLEESYE